MKKIILRLYENDVVRYVFFGGCTTMVNLISFYLLRRAGVPLNMANMISIVLAVLFAYVVNSLFVFRDTCRTFRDHIRPFFRFIGARLATMAVEMGGVWFLAGPAHFPDMAGKIITQILVLVLNYLFSRFFVFTTGKKNRS